MADEYEQPEREWDEYEWENFLQSQDLRTERYLELLEKYVDHPERDVLIAREMGWLDPEAGEDCSGWGGDLGSAPDQEGEVEFGVEFEEEADLEEAHPLYKQSFELSVWLESALEARGEETASDPAAMELAKQVCILGGKLAAALSDSEGSEIGMQIAYLKRALRAAGLALNAYAEVRRKKLFGRVREKQLRARLFEVRDGIVDLVGERRAAWRRLHGG